MDISAFLSGVRLFNVLPQEIIHALAENAALVDLKTDHNVFFQGDDADRVYIVLAGEVAVETISVDGRTVPIVVLRTGEVFGEMAVLDNGFRSANVRALQASRVVSVSKNTFLDLVAKQPDFALSLIRDLVSRLRVTDAQIESITLLSLRTRVAGLLLDLSAAQGSMIKITQADLAERVSATREKVNVNLQSLQSKGAVALSRGRIEIVDQEILRAMSR